MSSLPSDTLPLPLEVERQAALFDAIGEEYDTIFPEKSAQIEASRWLVERLPRGARVLDAGCGTGIPTAKTLAEAGLDVLGIDISREMLRIAQHNVPSARFERRHMTSLDLPERSLDAVTAFFSLLMLPRAEIEVTLRAFARMLRPGGHLVGAMVEADLDYVELPFHGHPARLTGYPSAELTAVLERSGFAILDFKQVEFTPQASDLPPERQLFFYCRTPA